MNKSKLTADLESAYDWAGASRTLVFFFSHHGPRDEADNLAQITIARLWEKLLDGMEITGDNGFQRILYGFAHNILKEAWRDMAALKRELGEVPTDEKLLARSTISSDPQVSIVWQEALEQLSERDQFIIIESESKGRKEENIAADLGISVKAYRVALTRAREKLKTILREPVIRPPLQS
jgi:RNA polymerase sigma factor (sigma-70 family)